MCILQPRLLLLACGAVVASALAPQLAAAQGMSRPGAPAARGTGTGSRPLTNPNAAPGMGGYGGGTSGSPYGGQGSPYGTGSPENGGDSGSGSEAPSDEKSVSRVLTAAGVPNDGSRPRWPVGLRVVGGAAGDEQRQQIEALLRYGAEQTHAGPVSPHLTRELARAVDGLRQLLRRDRQERFSLALTTYEDAERFLAKLDHARKLLEAEPASSPGERR